MKQITENYKLFTKESRTDEIINKLAERLNPERKENGFKPLSIKAWKAIVFKNPFFRKDIGELEALLKHETNKKINFILFK